MTAALFVLLPPAQSPDELLAAAPPEQRAAFAGLTVRRYPVAGDSHHLASLVRAGRDPLATRWRRGAITAVLAGAALGATVHGVLAGAFDLFGGLLAIAIPLGFCLGAFLGGFTAAMTGTEVPREELRPLFAQVRGGEVLVQFTTPDWPTLAAFAGHCRALGLPCVVLHD